MENIQTKKIIWTTSVIVVVVIAAFGLNYWKSKLVDAHPCAVNFLATFAFNATTTTPEATIAKTLLTQLLDQYKNMQGCPTMGITDYSIDSVGKAAQVKTDFTIPVTFDILPQSETATLWGTSETKKDGNWIRGKVMTLGIQNVSTTTASQSWRLVLP